MSRTRLDVFAVALTLAIAGGLTFALLPEDSPTAPVSPTAATVERTGPATVEPPSVLFIGDSYTAGPGVREISYGCEAAVRLGWLCNLSAVPGTGYISGGEANRFTVDPYIGQSSSFSERIPKLAMQYDPDVVVLDGGRNDQFPPLADVFNAMADTIAKAHEAWPAATIVFIRPRYLAHPRDDLSFDTKFVDRMVSRSGVDDVVVMDPIHRLVGWDTAELLIDDDIHPNRRGEHAITGAVVAEFLAHDLGVAP